MPGYEDLVIMAAGGFIEGSSIELSADGPMREPFFAYYQGGLTYDHCKLGLMKSLDNLYKNSKTTKTGLKCFFARQSKAYIDSIDKFIGEKYDLSTDEIDYIINYDIQFRNDEWLWAD